jgi:hypothetical protein
MSRARASLLVHRFGMPEGGGGRDCDATDQEGLPVDVGLELLLGKSPAVAVNDPRRRPASTSVGGSQSSRCAIVTKAYIINLARGMDPLVRAPDAQAG